MLKIECPHCKHEHLDDFEVLEVNRLSDMTCHACRKMFSFVIHDCDSCGSEQVRAWPTRPSPEGFEALSCEACGKLYGKEAEEHGLF